LASEQFCIPSQNREQLRQQKPSKGDGKGAGFSVERGEKCLQDRSCRLLAAKLKR
jgi:hypothetical protein